MSPANNSGLTSDQKSKQSRVTNPSPEYAYFKGTQHNDTVHNSKNSWQKTNVILSVITGHFADCQYTECYYN